MKAKLIALCDINRFRVIVLSLYKSAFYPLPNISSSFPRGVSNLFFKPEKKRKTFTIREDNLFFRYHSFFVFPLRNSVKYSKSRCVLVHSGFQVNRAIQ